MRLHLECLDWGADDEPDYAAQFSKIEDQTFRGGYVHVDNHQYHRCRFENCHFLYSGGPFGFSECELVAGMLSLMGSARWTWKLFAAFEEDAQQTGWPG